MPLTTDRPVILCGLGHVGWRVLDYLRVAGIPVIAVDDRCAPDDPRLGGVPLVAGDFRDRNVLERAGAARARGVLIVTSNDLVNLSAALMVRHLDPNVRIVIRLFNQNLLVRLGKALTNTFALSVSALTGPLLALTAVTGGALATFRVADGRRQVAEISITESSGLGGRRLADVTPAGVGVVAHISAEGAARCLLDVQQDARLQQGDKLVLCGRPTELAPLLASAGDGPLPDLYWAGWLRRLARVAGRTLREVDLPVKICTGILIGVILFSTLVYCLEMHKSPAQGLQRTISLIATGGHMHEEDFSAEWHRVFASALRLTGAALMGAFTAIFTNYLLRARLSGALEVRRIPDGGHVIVCGLGNIGFRVVEELLQSDERVVVIERQRDGRFTSAARRAGAAVMIGDAAVLEVLRQAHAATARAVVAATSDELANVEIALLARELNPHLRVVVRLLDPSLAETLRDAASIKFALAIPALAAPAFLAALFGDRVQSLFLVQGHLMTAVELLVQEADRQLLGRSVRALAAEYRLLPVHVCAADGVADSDMLAHRLRAGDRLSVIVALKDLQRLLHRDPAPADWQVEVTGFPPAARPFLTGILRYHGVLDSANAEAALARLPLCAASGLTRAEAEVLLERLARAGVQASPRQASSRSSSANAALTE
jgi:Trk K+ transport system NAD-binding subunit